MKKNIGKIYSPSGKFSERGGRICIPSQIHAEAVIYRHDVSLLIVIV